MNDDSTDTPAETPLDLEPIRTRIELAQRVYGVAFDGYPDTERAPVDIQRDRDRSALFREVEHLRARLHTGTRSPQPDFFTTNVEVAESSHVCQVCGTSLTFDEWNHSGTCRRCAGTRSPQTKIHESRSPDGDGQAGTCRRDVTSSGNAGAGSEPADSQPLTRSPQTPNPLERDESTTEFLPYRRLLELCAEFGVEDTDTLKHRLEDWERWNRALRGRLEEQ